MLCKWRSMRVIKTPNIFLCVSKNIEWLNLFLPSEESNKISVTMNGHSNYHVGQQTFYIYDSQFFKRLLDKQNGSSVTSCTHRFYPYKVTWNKARQACIRDGGKENNSWYTIYIERSLFINVYYNWPNIARRLYQRNYYRNNNNNVRWAKDFSSYFIHD